MKMDFIPKINISDYNYELPEGKIVQFPLAERDESKLLVLKDGLIYEDVFKNIPELLPADSLVIFNETKVIRARILFQKESGATIELFCMEPVSPSRELQQAFQQKSGVGWECLVGNSKRWKAGVLTKRFSSNGVECRLSAVRNEKGDGSSKIRFKWEPAELSFSEVLIYSGIIPLPPYINRQATLKDAERYQTIFAREEGSVAAPTAGLHFTESVFRNLKKRGIETEKVILHVGAGTFKPVVTEKISEHEMHAEKIIIRAKTVKKILTMLELPIVAVGTTTMRTIESLYWFGVKSLVEKTYNPHIQIGQWDPYNPRYNCGISVRDSLTRVLEIIENNKAEYVGGETRLMIVPSYTFRIPGILITNFHQPQSTLLLLVSAFTGGSWEMAYQYALSHDFRFLSYGDACLFFKH